MKRIGYETRHLQGELLALSLMILGLAILGRYFFHSYILYVDGQAHAVQALATNPRQLYARLGIPIAEADQLSWPAGRNSLNLPSELFLRRARPVRVITPDDEHLVETAALIPANILFDLGIQLFPKDLLLRDGKVIDPSVPLPMGHSELLVWQPARRLVLQVGGERQALFTQELTLGAALVEHGVVLGEADSLSRSLESPVSDGMLVRLARARPVRVQIGSESVELLTPLETAAAVLLEAGLSPQGLDKNSGDLDVQMPANAALRLERVDEELSFIREETPFNNSYIEDPEGELDTLSVIEAGQVGLVVSRTRLQVSGGEVLASQEEGPWKASDPADGVLGMGTIPVLKKAVVDGEEIEYWRKVSVYATGYMPKALGGDAHTASGLKLTKGIIAVTVPWYRAMKFQQVYVQGYGYGTIADTGGGIPGRPWIDLGFDDDNYVSWHHWTTMYFLAPIPAWVPVSLP